MLSFLRQPYPSPFIRPARALLVSCLLGGFVACFLIFFKPFDTANSSIPNLNLFLSGYGVVIAVVTFLPIFLLPRLFKESFSEERWTVGRHLLFNTLIVALGITASYFYLLRAGGRANLADYLYFSRNGLLVAAFPIVVITLLDYIRKLRYYENGARTANLPLRPDTEPAQTPITLHDDRDRPELTVDANRIWCLHSDGNYVEIWHNHDGGEYERTVIRNTLARLSEQLPPDRFLTCHRSWVVNPALVEEVTGNAQGYRLHRAGAPVVAVARGRSGEVLARLAAST